MIALVLAAAVCSGDCRAQRQFEAMERKLLRGPVQLEVQSHAEGAVQADAMTEVFVGPAMRLHTKGTFLGKPFARDFDQPGTTDLRDAVVVGLARMGLLHNVIDLAQGNGPEHADGTVREWLQPHDFRRVRGGVTYQLRVSDKETSEVTLTIKSGLPQKRTMTVHFPNGDMRVTETYRFPVKR